MDNSTFSMKLELFSLLEQLARTRPYLSIIAKEFPFYCQEFPFSTLPHPCRPWAGKEGARTLIGAAQTDWYDRQTPLPLH